MKELNNREIINTFSNLSLGDLHNKFLFLFTYNYTYNWIVMFLFENDIH